MPAPPCPQQIHEQARWEGGSASFRRYARPDFPITVSSALAATGLFNIAFRRWAPPRLPTPSTQSRHRRNAHCFHLAHIDVTRFTPPQTSTSVAGFFGTVFFAPIVETYILAVLITILSSFIQNKFHVAIVSGLLWGIGHAAFGLLWFFAPAWIFFVLTCSYMAWREKSFKHAYFAAFIPHALNNATAVIAVYLGRHA